MVKPRYQLDSDILESDGSESEIRFSDAAVSVADT